jgi:hypothetical protein
MLCAAPFHVVADKDVAQGGKGVACARIFLGPFGAKLIEVERHLDSQVRVWMVRLDLYKACKWMSAWEKDYLSWP